MRYLSLLVLLGACGDPNQGTAVGNPGNLSMAVDGLPPGADLRSGSLDVAALELVGEGRVVIERYDDPFDLVEPKEVAFPAGTWERVVILPRGDAPMALAGTNEDGSPFDLTLPVEAMVFEGTFVVDGDPVLVQLAVTNDRLADENVDQQPEPPPADGAGFSGRLGVGQGLYVDEDGDGIVRLDEQAAQVRSSEPGCNTSGRFPPFAEWFSLRRR